MSYIRCLSNPEGLYIWAEDGNVIITATSIPDLQVSVPLKDFETLLEKWYKYYPMDDPWIVGDLRLALAEAPDFRWELSYKGEVIIKLWDTTLMYVCTQSLIPKPHNWCPRCGDTIRSLTLYYLLSGLGAGIGAAIILLGCAFFFPSFIGRIV